MSGRLVKLLVRAADEKVAKVCSTSGEHLTAPDLLDAARGLASGLRARGLHMDEPVLVTVGNGAPDIAAFLGSWLAGAVAVPVHRTAAATTLRSVTEVTAARFLVDNNEIRDIGSTPPPHRPLLHGAALIIFTSGTTGQPKGVVIGQERLGGKLDVLQRLLRLGPDDVVVVPLQLTFIFGIWASLLAIGAGARLVLMSRFSTEALVAALGEGGTVLAAVPSMLRTVLAAGEVQAPLLRTILTGGESLGVQLAHALRTAFSGAGIYDLYGLTETGSCDFCLGPGDHPSGQGTIGSPTEGVEFRLATEDGPAAPIREAGELLIRSPFSMLGYLDQPELTEISFQDGYFRTGDIARIRADGRAELVGRSKEIISRGGNKIAPLELDNLLSSHPDVVAALCAGVPDTRLGEAIHAVVVVRAGTELTPEKLRQWAAERIERFKLPDAIHFRESLPMGSTGKASRSAVTALARPTS